MNLFVHHLNLSFSYLEVIYTTVGKKTKDAFCFSLIIHVNPYLNQATAKIIFLPRKSWNPKFKTHKTPQSSLSHEIQSTPPY